MKKIKYILILFAITIIAFTSCSKKEDASIIIVPDMPVTDIDGNVYKTVKIGTQIWMAENLRTTKYRDGSVIPYISDTTAWVVLNSDAYCSYENTSDLVQIATYGRLYNWFAATDIRNIAPAGWHVPSDAEWSTLTTYLGGEKVAGGKMKETGTVHWNSPNAGADNRTGFSALPGGCRNYSDGKFNYVGDVCFWWSSTAYDAKVASSLFIDYYGGRANYVGNFKQEGFSVRCVKD